MSIKTIALDTCPADEAPVPAMESVPGEAGGMIAGGSRAVIEALAAAAPDGVLGLVVDTTGSTYSKLGGAICIAGARGRVGWISGGCLESSLEQEAFALRDAGHAGFTEFDTRSDADLMFGTRIGCRGLVRIALLPMEALPGVDQILGAWTRQAVDVEFEFTASGEVKAAAGGLQRSWQVPWRDLQQPMPEFRVRIPRAPRLLVFGAGPEAALLLPWMRQLGWYVSLVERRARWTSQLALADVGQETMPAAAVSRLADLHHDAAIVMNHDFELDREALESLAETTVPWIGVLGPVRRRDDLLRLVGPSRTRSLRPRLHAPVGLPLGGRGPEAISLSIAAELHAHWNGAQAAAPVAGDALTAAL